MNDREALDLPPPPPPDLPPPELTPPSNELGIDVIEENNSDKNIGRSEINRSDSVISSQSGNSRLSMLPAPNFDELGLEVIDTIREE